MEKERGERPGDEVDKSLRRLMGVEGACSSGLFDASRMGKCNNRAALRVVVQMSDELLQVRGGRSRVGFKNGYCVENVSGGGGRFL